MNVLKELQKMCDSCGSCKDCPFYWHGFDDTDCSLQQTSPWLWDVDEIEKVVTEYSKTH